MSRGWADPPTKVSPRDAEIIAAVMGGETQASVAKRYGISRGRVAQIVRWVPWPDEEKREETGT
jgi:DNA-binding CsgD family transcriptional regulator